MEAFLTAVGTFLYTGMVVLFHQFPYCTVLFHE